MHLKNTDAFFKVKMCILLRTSIIYDKMGIRVVCIKVQRKTKGSLTSIINTSNFEVGILYDINNSY